MCGIAGILSFNHSAPSKNAISVMVNALRHRGPDVSQIWHEGPIQLGHTRLKVIDLSSASNQPMRTTDKTLTLVYNGEIYNFKALKDLLIQRGHTFKSDGDSEALLHLYQEFGSNCVKKLDGMFAFAIWDQRKKELFLAKDPTGKKPLYTYWDGNTFAFASEIKAFFKVPEVKIEIEEKNLFPFFLNGYLSAPKTLYKNISTLEAGHSMTITPQGKLEQKAYWDLHFPSSKRKILFHDACAELKAHMYTAVKKRLISDVPLGAFLSGGLDSSIIVSIMQNITSHPVQTFSVGFEGEPTFDETEYAREVAQKVKSNHHVLKVKSQDLVDHFDQILWHYDGPFGDSSALPTLMVSSLASKKVTVALNGDGGDELFTGYQRMTAAHYLQYFPNIFFKLGKLATQLFPKHHSHHSKIGKLHHAFSAASTHPIQSLREWLRIFYNDELNALIKKSNLHPKTLSSPIHSQGSILDQILYDNFKDYLQNDLNVKMDRAGMAFSLETRSPFLDRDLIEYVASLPDKMKLKGLTTKHILRETFKEHIPSRTLKRGKQGFGIPAAAWFRKDLKTFVSDFLLTKHPKYEQYLHTQQVHQIVQDHLTGTKERSRQIWVLLMFERWLQKLPLWTK